MARKFLKARGESWVNGPTLGPPTNLRMTWSTANDAVTVTFIGTASSGGTGLTTAAWSFGDGSTASTSIASGTATTSHTFAATQPTDYTVTITVTGGDGKTAKLTRVVHVDPGVIPPSTAGTLFGASERAPAQPPTRPTYIMNLYGGLQPVAVFDKHEARLRTASGFSEPLMKSYHTYNTTGFPTTLSQLTFRSEIASRGLAQLAMIQVPSSEVNSGQHDSALASLVRSIPDGIPRIWLSPLHEPDLDPVETSAGWTKAVARFAKIIEANRLFNGIDRDVWTVACTTSYLWRAGKSANGEPAANWIPYAAIVAAGADPGRVVWAPDGYAEDPATMTPASRFDAAFQPAKAAGMTQFGISEWGVKSYQPPASGSIDAGTTIPAAATYVDRMAAYAATWHLQFAHYFHSGVGSNSGPEGWWMYTTAMERAFGYACYYGGPTPVDPPTKSFPPNVSDVVYSEFGAPLRTDGKFPGYGRHEATLGISATYDQKTGAVPKALPPYPNTTFNPPNVYTHHNVWGVVIPTAGDHSLELNASWRLQFDVPQVYHRAAGATSWVLVKGEKGTGPLGVGALDGGYFRGGLPFGIVLDWSSAPATYMRSETVGWSVPLRPVLNADGSINDEQAILHWFFNGFNNPHLLIPTNGQVAISQRMRLISDTGADVSAGPGWTGVFSGDLFTSADESVAPNGINPAFTIPRHVKLGPAWRWVGHVTGTEAQIRSAPKLPFVI